MKRLHAKKKIIEINIESVWYAGRMDGIARLIQYSQTAFKYQQETGIHFIKKKKTK